MKIRNSQSPLRSIFPPIRVQQIFSSSSSSLDSPLVLCPHPIASFIIIIASRVHLNSSKLFSSSSSSSFSTLARKNEFGAARGWVEPCQHVYVHVAHTPPVHSSQVNSHDSVIVIFKRFPNTAQPHVQQQQRLKNEVVVCRPIETHKRMLFLSTPWLCASGVKR